MSKPVAPKGLSAGSRRRWVEQVEALDAVGRATPARLELVTSWAQSIDQAGRARAIWSEAGSPETETGSMGQERQHHLRVAVTRADALVANLAGKIERAGARRETRQPPVPTGARVLRRDGSYVELLVDGRVLVRSVSTGQWIPSMDEEDAASGGLLRWLDDSGTPVFADPPPSYKSGPPAREDCVRWAEAKGVPEQAVLAWLEHPTPRSKLLVRDDVDLVARVRRR